MNEPESRITRPLMNESGSQTTPSSEQTSGSEIARPYTGAEFLDSLDDGREVWIYGKRVNSVTEHPAFRNAARMIARLYDAMHDPARRDVLTQASVLGGFTHRFYVAPRSVEDQVRSRDAIAEWARITYGWMGRSPDFMASWLATLGGNAEFYAPYDANARHWYAEAQRRTAFFAHAIIDPPIDRNRAAEKNDVFVRVVKETDRGIVVTGAKVVATGAVLSHYTFVARFGQTPLADPACTPIFIVPTNAPGVKLICRTSNEQRAAVLGGPFDYPLSSRMDENDAIIVFDQVLVPWENVFMYGDVQKANGFGPGSGMRERSLLHASTRFATKLDFICGLLAKALALTGADEFHGVKVRMGEVISWRNLCWALSDALAKSAVSWKHMVHPDPALAVAYQTFGPEVMPAVKNIIEKVVASGLIYLNSHSSDFDAPEIRPYLDRYVRGSDGSSAIERVKLMKLLWDAIGSEFGARHELYEMNYAGSSDHARLSALAIATRLGDLDRFKRYADQYMDEYDLHGWTVDDMIGPEDISVLGNRPATS